MSERPTLTTTQRWLIAAVATFAIVIAGIGFAGSYTAVRELAQAKGFGQFAHVFPIGLDAGIGATLALDLLLTWLRIPFPLLRHTAWLLTAATIAFNAAAAWPDPIGVGMHAVIPILFVVVVEAARHAIGRLADITADRHMESVRLSRWLLAPWPTFRLWRRMKLWELRSYDEVVRLEQERLIYRTQLHARYGRAWRRKAPVALLTPLRLARYGVAVADAPAAIASAKLAATPTATATATPKPPRSAPATKAATPTLPAATTTTATIEAPATPEPATVAPVVAAGHNPYEPGTAQHIVYALWVDRDTQPGGPAIVDALGAAGLPNSPQQARKIRAQVRREHEDLPGPRQVA